MTRLRASLWLALLMGLLGPASAQAAVFNVNSTLTTSQCDGTTCTLLGALTAAQSNGSTVDDTINVPAGTFPVNASGLTVTSPRITLAGAGANATIIQPVQIGRPLTVNTTLFEARDLTLRGGSETTGGNVLVNNSSTATFTRVRITAGSATQGGGIAITGATSVTIRQSLIDGNAATGQTATDAGGGIFIQSQTFGTTVTIDDSTIFRNTARIGAGLGVLNNTQQAILLRGVTLTDNRAPSTGAAAGMYFSAQSPLARIEGSIVANNVAIVNLGNGTQRVPANCAGSSFLPADGGGNLESAADCGLAGHQNADPLLAPELDTSAQPPVLSIPANSPAVDIAACGPRTVDQRGVARPQGSACDAGAYEVPVAVVTPTPTPTPVVTATPTPTATPTLTPVRNKSVVAKPISGKVLIKVPGAKTFAPLDLSLIRNGAEVDVRKGKVEITQAGGGVATFYDGIFKLSQSGGITTLTLTEKLAPCSGKRARAAAAKPKTRKLWGSGKGKFRTRGQYGAATIRGTKWLLQDGCRYTLTRVAQGAVTVRDEVKRKTIILRKGKHYTARPRR